MGPVGRVALCVVLSAALLFGYGEPTHPIEPTPCPLCPNSGALCLNETHCVCPPGYRPPQPWEQQENVMCADINECVERSLTPPCGSGQRCINMGGGFRCECIDGYRELRPPTPPQFITGTPPIKGTPPTLICIDVNECEEGGGPCGGGSVCLNTPGSFECHCPPGTQRTIEGNCNSVTEPPPPPLPSLPPHLCPINQSRCELSQNLSQLWAELEGGGDPRHVLQALLALLDAALMKVNGDDSAPQRHLRVTALLGAAESVVRAAAPRMRGNGDGVIDIKEGKTELLLALPPAPPGPPIRLQHPDVGLEVPREVAGGGDNALVALLLHPHLRDALGGVNEVQWKPGWVGPPRTEAGGRLSFQLLTHIGTAIVSDPPAGGGNVTLGFKHHYKPDPRLHGRPLCAFWDPKAQSWGTDGCELLPPPHHKGDPPHNKGDPPHNKGDPPHNKGDPPHFDTVCVCNHLTSFVVLLAFYEPEHSWLLDVLTKAGLVLSVVSLLLAIVTFVVCRVPKGLRRILHLQLSISLMLAHGTFLLGIERTHSQPTCAVVAGLLHFWFLCAFTWMLLEGLHLYVLLVRVFQPAWLRVWHALVSGYGLPAIIVICSAIAYPDGYGTTQYCWLTLDRGFRWSFQGPVCLIVALNAVILVITIWKLVQKFDEVNPDLGHLRKMRVLSGTCAAQLCLLGTGWALGLPQPWRGNGEGSPAAPPLPLSFLFCIINASQGLFILICHCLVHPQVRDTYRRWLCPGSRRYTEFSTSHTSNTSNTRVHHQHS